jgi:16S rRNA (cytidine1402-2'-O)-methyltransferase
MTLKGGLYIIATPIGNLKDITLRALEILKECDLIACEDTRVSRKLLSAYSINKPLVSYHDHNADHMRPQIIHKISEGKAIALISDAGTPLISDPGYKLVRDCYEKDLSVTCLPGPSSVMAGLVLSGMPTDRFLFAGFAQKKDYADLSSLDMTLIFFESAQRLIATLKEMSAIFPNRTIAVVREITKLFEEVRRGSFEDLIQFYEEKGQPKGEIVLVLSPPGAEQVLDLDVDQLLRQTLQNHSIRDACTLVAGTLGVPRKQIYQRALMLKQEE